MAFFLLAAPWAAAQFTTVTGTVKDPNNLPYANGTITSTLVISGSPVFIIGNTPYTPPSAPTGLDANGHFLVNLADVNALRPPGGTWTFKVCSSPSATPPPVGTGPVCFTVTGVIITGPSQDITAVLNAAAPPLTIPIGSGSIAPGTPGFLAIYTATSAIGSDPNCDDGVTNAGQVTCANTINTPQVSLTGAGGGYITSPGGVLPTLGAGNGGFGVTTGALPEINVNNAWFFAPYLSVGGTALAQNQANFGTLPAAPANGINVQWQNSGANMSASIVGDGNSSHALCGNGVFAVCTAAGATALSGLIAATGNNTMGTNGNFLQVWPWALTGATSVGMTWNESVASTGGTALSQFIAQLATLGGSTAVPLNLSNNLTGSQTLPSLYINPSWNTTGIPSALLINVTNTASATGAALMQAQTSGSNQFVVTKAGLVAANNGYAGVGNAGITTYCGGPGLNYGATCAANLGVTLGGAQLQGGDNSNTTASAGAGLGLARGGMLTAATPNAAAVWGLINVGAGALKGTAIANVGDLLCPSSTTPDTLTDCPLGAVNVVGIASNTTQPIGVIADGQALVRFDAAVTVGDKACGPPASTGTVGLAHDPGAGVACPANQGIGVIAAVSGTVVQMSGAATASTAMSTTLAKVWLHIQ